MSVRQDVFGLETLYRLQVEGQWTTKSEVWLAPSPYLGFWEYGYFGGGRYVSPSGSRSRVERIDFSNDTDTSVFRGNLISSFFQDSASTGNSYYGYFGGYLSGYKTISRLDYGNDTQTGLARGQLNTARYNMGATGNQSYGYFGGGKNPSASPIAVSTVDRIDYSNDTEDTVVKGPLAAARAYIAATGNSSYGWFAGGSDYPATTQYTKIDRINYSNDTVFAAVRSDNASPAYRYFMAGTGNADFGYFGGGQVGGSQSSRVNRLDYSNDTTTPLVKGPLSRAKRTQATGNPSYGWFGGGPGPGPSVSEVDRIDYANDTATAPARGLLSGALMQHSAVSSRDNGLSNKSLIRPSLSPASNFVTGVVETFQTGYFAGGYGRPSAESPSIHKSSVDRIDYANDTALAVRKGYLNNTFGRYDLAGTGNAFYGYFGGGTTHPGVAVYSTVDRIDYANDSNIGLTRGPLSLARQRLSAVGNASFGYFVGGYATSIIRSNIDRIDYSNDTAAATPVGPLPGTNQQTAATGTQSYGYIGGSTPTVIQRIDYSNDTPTTTPAASLNFTGVGGRGATGNANYGYFGAGTVPGPVSSSSEVERIDYSNDTATALIRGPLTQGRSPATATGNAFYGYFAGGEVIYPDNESMVERIDYANDTATALIRGPLPEGRRQLGASSARANGFSAIDISTVAAPSAYSRGYVPVQVNIPTNYAFFIDGNIDTAPYAGQSYSKSSRIDYTTDTLTALPRGSSAGTFTASASSSYFGYFASGSPSGSSTIRRFDYSNDLETSIIRGLLSLSRASLTGSGNSAGGYFGGGSSPAPAIYTTVDRIDYSNDTATAAVKGPLNVVRYNLAATGNASGGYFAGGQNPSISPSTITSVDRVDYANDTATASPKGPLSIVRILMKATGNSEGGYFAGGSPQASKVERIDYSNDTATPVEKGPLNVDRFYHGATGNSNFGYFGGGGSGTEISSVERIDYANDTVIASFRGPLEIAKKYLDATSAAENGLPQ